jgi:hypothetical protein
MQGIETLQEQENSLVKEVLCRWQGMNILLVMTLGLGGKRCLYARPADVTSAALTTEGLMARWTILKEAEAHSDAIACTISNGSAPNVTEPNT